MYSPDEKSGDPVSQDLSGPERGLALVVVVANTALALFFAFRAEFPAFGVQDDVEPRTTVLEVPDSPRLAQVTESTTRPHSR